jgi:hypothetical protein
LTVEDVQRRLAQQVSELHLDERFQSSREVIGKHLATGQKKVSTAFNSLWADMEAMREAQRKRALEQKAAGATADATSTSPNGRPAVKFPKAPDLSQAQASVAAAGQKAGAYFSSWGTWASEKRKTGWRSTSATVTPVASPTGDVKMKHESSAASSWTQVSIPAEKGQGDEHVDVEVSPSTPEKKFELKELATPPKKQDTSEAPAEQHVEGKDPSHEHKKEEAQAEHITTRNKSTEKEEKEEASAPIPPDTKVPPNVADLKKDGMTEIAL